VALAAVLVEVVVFTLVVLVVVLVVPALLLVVVTRVVEVVFTELADEVAVDDTFVELTVVVGEGREPDGAP